MTQRSKNKKKNGSIKIFATERGVNVIKSPIKAKILSILSNGGLSASKIVEMTGKSKSTISAHLMDLLDEGIVDYRPDPSDRRRKIFFIKSRYIGDLETGKEFEKEVETYLERVTESGDPFEFFRFVFRTIRVALMEEGVNIDPILHNAGLKVGETFYKKLESEDLENLTEKIAAFWQKNNLGRIEVKKLDPLTIRAYDCFECEDLPQIGRSACAFDSGVLEAVFSAHFGEDVHVEEVKCYAKGDKYCCFVIDKAEG